MVNCLKASMGKFIGRRLVDTPHDDNLANGVTTNGIFVMVFACVYECV